MKTAIQKVILISIFVFSIFYAKNVSAQQNIGIGISTPSSRLDVKGTGTTSATSSFNLQNSVGTQLMKVTDNGTANFGSSSQLTIDASGNLVTSGTATLSALSAGQIMVTGTGGVVSTVSAPTSGMYLQWNGSTYVWATASSSLSTLTAGTGLTSTTYNGSAPVTFSIDNTGVTAASYGTSTSVPQIAVNAQGQITSASNVTISAAGIGAVTSVSGNNPIIVAGTTTAPVINLQGTNADQGGVLYSTGTGASALFNSTGTSGQVLQSNGTGAPTWVNASSLAITSLNGQTGSSQTFSNAISGTTPAFSSSGNVHTLNIPMASSGASVTAGLLSNTEYAALLAANGTVTAVTASSPLSSTGGATPDISLSGTVPVANGGTGFSSYTIGDIVYASSSTAFTKLSDVGAGCYLRSGGVGAAPAWSTLKLPNSATTGDILYANGSNSIGNLADVATTNVLRSGGVGVAPSWGKVVLTTDVSGIVPIANGGTNISTIGAAGTVEYSNGTQIASTAVGTTGQVLTSNGASAPSFASGFLRSNHYIDFQTAANSGTAVGNTGTLTGLSRTISLTAGDRVVIHAKAGIMSSVLGYGTIQLICRVGGSNLSNGTAACIGVDDNYAYANWNTGEVISYYDVPSTASYTFTTVYYVSRVSGTVTIGGGTNSVLQGVMELQVLKQ